MACNIKRDSNNNIVRVDAENGKESLLFLAINSNPHLTSEQALEAYKNTFTENFPIANLDENLEPILSYKAPNGEVYETYAEALQNTTDGFIEGVYNDFTFFKIDANTNPKELSGFINNEIKKGNLSDKAVVVDGVKKLQGNGEGILAKYANAQLTIQNTERVVKLNLDGTIDIIEPVEEQVDLSKTDRALISFMENNDIFPTSTPIEREVNTLTQKELTDSLKTFLNRLGVNLTSIEDYIEIYKNKNGQEPTAEALADIANRIVAFTKGEANLDTLTEETSHFALEAFQDQDTLNRLLENIHLTEEWKQDAQRYLEVYSANYSGAELDNIVRREIAGKILAKKLKNNFEVNEESNVDLGITNLLGRLFTDFINRIRQIFSPSLQNELDVLLDNVADNILNDNFENNFSEGQLDKSQFVFYSLQDKRVVTTLNNSLNALRKESKRLKAQGQSGFDKDVTDLQRILEGEIYDKESWMAIKILTNSTANHVGSLKSKVAQIMKQINNGDSNKNQLYLSTDEVQSIEALGELTKVLKEVKSVIKNGIVKPIPEIGNVDAIQEELTKRIEDIDDIQGSYTIVAREGLRNVAQKFIAQNDLTLSEEEVMRKIEEPVKDITFFGKNFGGFQYANNQWLRLAGRIFTDIILKTQALTAQYGRPLLNKFQKLNLSYAENKTLVELDDKGVATGYTISPIMWGKYLDAKDKAEKEAKAKVLNTTVEELPQEINLATDQKEQYDIIMDAWREDNEEQALNKEARDARKEKDKLLSSDTKALLKELSKQRAMIMTKYRDNSGKIDYTTKKLTASDELAIQNINKQRAILKSKYTLDGDKKTGTDLRIAEELIARDEQYEKEEKEIKETYLQTLKTLENSGIDEKDGNRQSWRTVKLSGGLTFTRDFFGEPAEKGQKPKIVQAILDLETEEIKGVDKTQFAEELEGLLEKRTAILRMNRKVGSPSETDTSLMSSQTKQTIANLDEQISLKFRDVNALLKENEKEELRQVETESTANKAYREDLLDKGIKENTSRELDFINENVSKDVRRNIGELQRKISNLLSGGTTNIEPKFRRIFENQFNLDPNLTEEEFLDEVLNNLANNELETAIAYGKTQLYSYYKRYAPKGYETFERALEAGEIKPSDLLENREQLIAQYPAVAYIILSPNYLFTENKDETDLNPEYDQNWEGGYNQPKKSVYRNEKYFEMFAFDAQGNATKNKEKYDLLQEQWKVKRIIDTKHQERVDIYKLPQISQKDYEKVTNIPEVGLKETAKRYFDDKFKVKVDQFDYGVQNTQGGNEIPKAFRRTLEERSDVTLNTAWSYQMMLHEAIKYEQKREQYPDLLMIERAILDSTYTGDKQGDNTNTYQMFKEHIDAQIFEISSNVKLVKDIAGQQIDLSKMSAVLDRFLRSSKLKYNIPVAVTNFLTSSISKRIESVIGQYLNQNSLNYAVGKFSSKYASEMISETGKLAQNSKLSLFLERAGLNDSQQRLENSSMGRSIRVLGEMGWGFMELGARAVQGQTVLTVIDDMRNVEGQFMNFKTYATRSENSNLNKAQILENWNTKYRSKSIENSMDVVDGVLTWNAETLAEIGQEKLDNILLKTMALARTTAGKIDAQVLPEDKSTMSRHILGRYTLGMRGFLVTTLDRRFATREFNSLTNSYEEGNYVTTLNFANNILKKAMNERNMMKLYSAVKQDWADMDDNQRQNLKRTLLEFSVFVALATLGVALVGYADDDENKDKWALQFATYMYLRTEAESSSPTVGLPGQLIDAVEKPFLTISMLKQSMPAEFLKVVGENSKFGGMPNYTAFALKQMAVVSNTESLMNINRTAEAYRKNNMGTLWFLANEKSEE